MTDPTGLTITDRTCSKNNIIRYLQFIVLGAASLLPYTAIITPTTFWSVIYGKSAVTIVASAYQMGNQFTALFMFIKGFKVNRFLLITVSIYIWLVCLLIIPLLHLIISDATAKLILVMIPIICCGAANAIFAPIVLAIGSSRSQLYTHAFMVGQSVAYIVSQLILVLNTAFTTGATKEYIATQTLTYFIVSILVICGCLIIVWNFLSQKILFKSTEANVVETALYVVNVEEENLLQEQEPRRTKFCTLLKSMRAPFGSIMLVYTVTSAIFPTICAKFPSQSSWWSIILSSVFILGDYVGRQAATLSTTKLKFKLLHILALSRAVFLGIFLMMLLPKYAPLIRVDALTILVMILFGLSSGWLTCVVMMKYTEILKLKADINLAAIIQLFMLSTGVQAGGMISMGIMAGLK